MHHPTVSIYRQEPFYSVLHMVLRTDFTFFFRQEFIFYSCFFSCDAGIEFQQRPEAQYEAPIVELRSQVA